MATRLQQLIAERLGHGPIGLYPFAFSECLNSDPGANPTADADGNGFIDDGEAHDWLVRQHSGFIPAFVGLTNYMLYPAGPATATDRDPELLAQFLPDPQPRKFTVGTDPFATVLTVYNGTASNKTDFHI